MTHRHTALPLLLIVCAASHVAPDVAAATPPSHEDAPPPGKSAIGPRRYATPGPMLYDVISADGAFDRSALCELEAECLGRPPGDCLRYQAQKQLTSADEAELGACLHLADHCRELVDCLQLESKDAEPVASPVRADGTLDIEALCRIQSACTGESVEACVDYVTENPARPREIAEIGRCYAISSRCEDLSSCLSVPGRVAAPTRYLSKRRMKELATVVDGFRTEFCACQNRACRDEVLRRSSDHIARLLRVLAGGVSADGELPEHVRQLRRRARNAFERCAEPNGGARLRD